MLDTYKYSELTERIIGAAMKVHNTLGCGFQEKVFQRSLAIELSNFGLIFKREFAIDIFYDGNHVGTRRVDFLVEDKIAVEIKALMKLEKVHFAQAINYLEAFNLEIGLLINFGSTRLEFKRIVNPGYKAESSFPKLQS